MSNRVKNIIRGVIFVISITFILLGYNNGEQNKIFEKAKNICLECIGIG